MPDNHKNGFDVETCTTENMVYIGIKTWVDKISNAFSKCRQAILNFSLVKSCSHELLEVLLEFCVNSLIDIRFL